jgi:4-carboxymuconolactone decarboxylase
MRVAPITPGSKPELAKLEAQILAERGRISPLYQVLLNSPAIATGWEQMLSAVRNRSSLPANIRELVILRVAVLNRAAYEFEAHVPHAQKAGVSEAAINACRESDLSGEHFCSSELLALQLTDQMTQHIYVPDTLFAQVREHYSPQGQIELTATIAAYNMVSRFLVALQIGH